MEKEKINLPSDLLQKEFEDNPLKIIELMSKKEEVLKDKSEHIENKNKSFLIKAKANKNDEEIDSQKEKTNNYINDKNKKMAYINIINKINNINDNDINTKNIIINNNINKSHFFNNNENVKNNDISNFNSSNIYLGNIININNHIYNFINNYDDSKQNINNKNHLMYDIKTMFIYLNTHKGSIFYQNFLDEIDNKELCLLFNNIIPYICKIMCLEYGNYFIQKLIKKLNNQQRLIIFQIIEPNFIEIATNKSGTHSIQSLIESIRTPYELLALDKLLSKNMLLLFLDENAYHIIMKIILEISEDKRKNLNLFLILNIEKIIINYYGAFCVNKFIIKNKDLNLRTLLIQNLQNNIQILLLNKCSCKVLFFLIEKFGVRNGIFIIKYIQNNFAFLSSHPIAMVFILKILNYLYKNDPFELGILIWFVYKNNILLKYLFLNDSGKTVLNQMIKLSDDNQRQYVLYIIEKIKMKMINQ